MRSALKRQVFDDRARETDMRSALKRQVFALSLALGGAATVLDACGPTELSIGRFETNDGGDGGDGGDGFFPDASHDTGGGSCIWLDASSDAGFLLREPVMSCRPCLMESCCDEVGQCIAPPDGGSSCDSYVDCYFQCIAERDAGGFDASSDGASSDARFDSSFDDSGFDDSGFDASSSPDGGASCESVCGGLNGANRYRALLRCAQRECPCGS